MNLSFKVEIEKAGGSLVCGPYHSDPLSWSWEKGKKCLTISFTTEDLREMLNMLMHSCVPSTRGMEAGGSGL